MLKIQYVITVALLTPSFALAATTGHNNGFHNNGSNVNYRQHTTQSTQVHEDRNQLNSEETGLQDSDRTLRNDEKHGNPSEVAADREQIAELHDELDSARLNLRQDEGYTYAHRRDNNTDGWGSHYNDNSNSHYHGWND